MCVKSKKKIQNSCSVIKKKIENPGAILINAAQFLQYAMCNEPRSYPLSQLNCCTVCSYLLLLHSKIDCPINSLAGRDL